MEFRPAVAFLHNSKGANESLGPSSERIDYEVNVRVRESTLGHELGYVGAQGTVEGQYQHADLVG